MGFFMKFFALCSCFVGRNGEFENVFFFVLYSLSGY